jgi:hypothetical protein
VLTCAKRLQYQGHLRREETNKTNAAIWHWQRPVYRSADCASDRGIAESPKLKSAAKDMNEDRPAGVVGRGRPDI